MIINFNLPTFIKLFLTKLHLLWMAFPLIAKYVIFCIYAKNKKHLNYLYKVHCNLLIRLKKGLLYYLEVTFILTLNNLLSLSLIYWIRLKNIMEFFPLYLKSQHLRHSQLIKKLFKYVLFLLPSVRGSSIHSQNQILNTYSFLVNLGKLYSFLFCKLQLTHMLLIFKKEVCWKYEN